METVPPRKIELTANNAICSPQKIIEICLYLLQFTLRNINIQNFKPALLLFTLHAKITYYHT